ncbi:MAG: cysteine--tRNA ligase [Clostridia bacterium]|nr:cysteine--tRNA ligase [Clostridia bacterium]
MRIFNTLTRRKEDFIPLVPGKVGLYGCGPTVYHYFHIGNARAFIVFDMLRRVLERRGYEVTFVQNFTDIDDRMIDRAREQGISVSELADRFIAAYLEDAAAIGIRPATVQPRATEHMPEIIAIIGKLMDRGFAYEANGDVYFDTKAYGSKYGRLIGQNIEDLESGARVAVDEMKKHPADFALWKAQKPGEPAWESPWGKGRPGWHIECSAMSMKYLGETIDIHGGGQDLVFPHHENELAQSEGATGKPFVRYWMHNGFLNIEGEKMSKSLDNFVLVRDIRRQADPEAVRFFLLSAHYRSPLNFTRSQIDQAAAALSRLYTARDNYLFLRDGAADREPDKEERVFCALADDLLRRFDEALDDDLNTADAIGVLFELVKHANIALRPGCSITAIETVLEAFRSMTGILGLADKKQAERDVDIDALVNAREEARKAKDWAESDRLRDELKTLGYSVEDTAQGQKVTKR